MRISKISKILIFLLTILILTGNSPVFSQDHIKDLDALRSAMDALGKKIPDMIRASKNNDLRTLERVYEINTYALTTIEAYFKMIKVAVSTDGIINRQIVDVFNGWLEFIRKYCKKDIEYLDEALTDTNNPKITEVLNEAKKNMQSLSAAADKAINENNHYVKK